MGYWIFILNPRPSVLGNPGPEGHRHYSWEHLLAETRRRGEAVWDWSHDPSAREVLPEARQGDGVVIYSMAGRPQVMGFAELTSDGAGDGADGPGSTVKIRATARAEHTVGPEVLLQFQRGAPNQRSIIPISLEDWNYLVNLIGRRKIHL